MQTDPDGRLARARPTLNRPKGRADRADAHNYDEKSPMTTLETLASPQRILVAVAHPDEAEEYAAGTIARLADAGHLVKIISMTNGDAGHMALDRKVLARRRAREAYDAGKILGVASYEIMQCHDGGLVNDIATRDKMVRRIRSWQADVVIAFHDEGTGHQDNRASAQIVRDAIPMTMLRNVCRRIPPLARIPVCLRMIDFGSVSYHRPDLEIDITDVIERKLQSWAAHATQFMEFAPYERGLIPPKTGGWEAQREFFLENWGEFCYASPVSAEEDGGADTTAPAGRPRFAETYEIAPYGAEITASDLASAFASMLRAPGARPLPADRMIG